MIGRSQHNGSPLQSSRALAEFHSGVVCAAERREELVEEDYAIAESMGVCEEELGEVECGWSGAKAIRGGSCNDDVAIREPLGPVW